MRACPSIFFHFNHILPLPGFSTKGLEILSKLEEGFCYFSPATFFFSPPYSVYHNS